MTNDLNSLLARIDRALARIEHAASARHAQTLGSDSDGRYQRLRTRTQAALAELDSVIARVPRSERG